MQIQSNYPLSKITTFGIGGPAAFFVEVTTEDELQEALINAQEKNLQVQILGGGSNVLVSDNGFQGLVILNKVKGLEIDESGLVTIHAGENWDEVVAKIIEKNLAGVECLSGIPGSAGGAVVQNIGAYGQTVGDLVVQVWATEVKTSKEKVFTAIDCNFKYRSSYFKENSNKYIVTKFQLQLIPGGSPTINYAHVKKHFENKPTPSLTEVREFIIRLRASKGYVIMPGYESFKTAGSYFRNPVVTKQDYERLKPILGDESFNRFWATAEGYKLAAAFLMQESGFIKGYREGNVGISPKHSLSIVNFGGAKAIEVKTLADKIKKVVFDKFGVSLEEEVLFV